MASDDLELLLHQFSSGGASLPILKSSRQFGDGGAGDGLQDSFREILSRSPFIFIANKRQEALLVHAQSLERPAMKFASSVPQILPSSIKHSLSPPREEIRAQIAANSNSSPKKPQLQIAMARSGRTSAPPALQSTAAGEAVEKRGKQAVLQRLEHLRSNDDVRQLFQDRVGQHLARAQSPGSGALSPLRKNVKEAKLRTLQSRIQRLEELKMARELAMQRVRESLVNQRQIFMDRMAEKSRHEQWLELKRAQQRERAIQKAKDELSQKWATISVVINSYLSIKSLIVLSRLKMPLLRRLKYSTRVVMKTYKQYRLWKEMQRVEKEKNVCSRICWRYLMNRRIKKKIWALCAIKEMLGILKSMGVLQKAVRSFKYRVIVGQRCIASFLAISRARLRVQQLQWAVMHLAWAKAVAERQAKLNKTKVPPTVSAVYQRLWGHYKSHGFRPPPSMVKRYCTFIRGSELFLLVVDTNAEEIPYSTALLVIRQLMQCQKDIRKQYIERRAVALAGNAKIKEQEKTLRIRMQARALLCKMSVEEKMKYEENVLQLQRTYAKAPAYPCTMLKSHLLKLMADYVAKADASLASAASVSVKMEVIGD